VNRQLSTLSLKSSWLRKLGKKKREYRLSLISDKSFEKIKSLSEAPIEEVFTDPTYGKVPSSVSVYHFPLFYFFFLFVVVVVNRTQEAVNGHLRSGKSPGSTRRDAAAETRFLLAPGPPT
jgi:hypothetical protein